MGNDLVIHLNFNLKRKKSCSEDWKAFIHIQPHCLPMGNAAIWGLAPGRKSRHVIRKCGDVTNHRLWQGAGVLGAEYLPRTRGSLWATHYTGCAPGTRLAFWGWFGYHLQAEILLPCHMSSVRSPRKCLTSFYTPIFLLTPSNFSRFTEQENQNITMGLKNDSSSLVLRL